MRLLPLDGECSGLAGATCSSGGSETQPRVLCGPEPWCADVGSLHPGQHLGSLGPTLGRTLKPTTPIGARSGQWTGTRGGSLGPVGRGGQSESVRGKGVGLLSPQEGASGAREATKILLKKSRPSSNLSSQGASGEHRPESSQAGGWKQREDATEKQPQPFLPYMTSPGRCFSVKTFLISVDRSDCSNP